MKTIKNIKKNKPNKQKTNKHKLLDRVQFHYTLNNHNPDIKQYETIFTIIEPTDISKRVMNFTLLRTILKGYGLRECNQFDCMRRKPMFVWLNYDENSMHGLKRKYYNTQVYLQNSLTNMDMVASNEQLHLGMKEKYPEIYEKHLKHSFLLNKSWKPKSNQVYIARPINVLAEKQEKGIQGVGYGGKDIIVIHDNKTLKDARKNLEKYDNVLISEYITNPLLFKKKKFHIRTFLLASIINNEFNSYMLDFGRILTAKDEYKNSDYSNPDIHDTHLKSTDADYFFPLDFTEANIGVDNITNKTIDNIFQQIKEIFIGVAKLLSEKVNTYDNIKNGFNIFGVDLMIENNIENNYNVILIEVNDEGTYKVKQPETRSKIDSLIFNWVDEVIFKKLFNSQSNKSSLYTAKLTHTKHINT